MVFTFPVQTIDNVVFQQLLKLNASERRSTLLLFAYGFGNAAAYVVARTVADSAFLSRIGPDQLPKAYLVSAVAVALASGLYGKVALGSSVRRSALLALMMLAATSAALPTLMQLFPKSYLALAVVYVLAQLRGSIGTIQYVILINEQFAHRQPERIVGIVGLGATSAGFILGLALGYIVPVVDVASLMYLASAIDLLTMLPVLLLPSKQALSAQAYAQEEALFCSEEPADLVRIRPQRQDSVMELGIASMVAVGVVAATLVEFQWKVTAANELHRDESSLGRYFAFYYGGVYLLTGTLQFFATGAVLGRRGILVGLLIFPGALLVTSVTAFLASADRLLLWTVTLTKGCDALKRSMNDPSIVILYGLLNADRRHQIVTLVSGVIKPLAEAAAAFCLVVMMPFMPARFLSVVVVALVAVWFGLDILVWRSSGDAGRDGNQDLEPAESVSDRD